MLRDFCSLLWPLPGELGGELFVGVLAAPEDPFLPDEPLPLFVAELAAGVDPEVPAPFVLGSGTVVGEVLAAPATLGAGELTLTTSAGVLTVAVVPERPINTPTPIASSNTPTPAMTVVQPPPVELPRLREELPEIALGKLAAGTPGGEPCDP
jgi:hypothetical protein